MRYLLKNPKFQAPNKTNFKARNPKLETKSFWSLGIEIWNLFRLPARSRFGEGRDL
jgi:hypothetical protein